MILQDNGETVLTYPFSVCGAIIAWKRPKVHCFFLKYKEKFAVFQKCSTRLYGPFSPLILNEGTGLIAYKLQNGEKNAGRT